MEEMKNLFENLQERKMDRRQLMTGVVLAAAAAAVPSFAANGATKASWVNHYTYVAPDLKKTRDWYHEVFGMQVGHEDAKTSHMWYGDRGDTVMIIRQAEAGEQAPRIHKFGFTVDYWDAKAVEAELKRKGLQPQADAKK